MSTDTRRYSSTVYSTRKEEKRLTALLQQKGSASASAVQKSRRVEHAAELPADLTFRHLLQSPEIKGDSSPNLVPLGLGFQRLPLGHTHTLNQVSDYQSAVSQHNPSHFYQASIQEIKTGAVEPH